MEWSAQQEAALEAVAEWRRTRSKPWFYLAGYAGTGKTTLARHFAEGLDGAVIYGAYTGKAASVMRAKGCHGATTIHRLIYRPSGQSSQELRKLKAERDEAMRTGATQYEIDKLSARIAEEVKRLRSPLFDLNEDADCRSAALLIIDECSMINGRMADDLLSFDVPVLVLGDPAQLPPVGGEGFFTSHEPDYMLTDVHRQARESGILRLATDIRSGKNSYNPADYTPEAMLVRVSAIRENPQQVLDFDQIIVGTNAKRHATNKRVRELLGHEYPMPRAGERLMCLMNNHDLGLLNGEVYTAVEDSGPEDRDTVSLHIEPEDCSTEPQWVEAWRALLLGQKLEHHRDQSTQEFSYGYAMTGHKSQGSGFPRVLAFDQSHVFCADARRWLYTVATRASEHLTLVR